MAERSLSFALDMNDRTVALHLGLSPLPTGVTIEHVPQTTDHRHERMLDSMEWDICEFSLATYIAARANGSSLRAVAIFPRRLFAMSLLYVRHDSGVTTPKQLIGRRVGIRSFHTTVCVWGLGDLASVYGVPLSEVAWVTERRDPFPVHREQGWNVEAIGHDDSLDAAFERGHLDAILVPRVPRDVRNGTAVSLFEHIGDEIRSYHRSTGVFPIMHTIVVRDEVLSRHPELPGELRASFEHSKQVGSSFYDDPNWCRLAQANEVLQAERAWLGDDPYPYGLEANTRTLARLISYERDLGLVPAEFAAENLFLDV
jgi:4,5-dihydroxyphthalate decarboxylase